MTQERLGHWIKLVLILHHKWDPRQKDTPPRGITYPQSPRVTKDESTPYKGIILYKWVQLRQMPPQKNERRMWPDHSRKETRVLNVEISAIVIIWEKNENGNKLSFIPFRKAKVRSLIKTGKDVGEWKSQ